MLAKAIRVKERDKGYKLFREVTEKYPHSNAAPFAYLEMARMLQSSQDSFDVAVAFFRRAFDMEFYSSEAAPIAMFEYAGFVGNDLALADSAIAIYDELSRRYFIET